MTTSATRIGSWLAATIVFLLLQQKNGAFINLLFVDAFSTGAGACPANMAAVQSSHLATTKTQTTGSLENGNLSVALVQSAGMSSSETLLSTAQAAEFAINQDYTLRLTTTPQGDGSGTFRGFLFRLGPPTGVAAGAAEANGTEVITTIDALQVSPDDTTNVQVATTVCVNNEEVGGLTHTSSVGKQSASGSLRMDQVATGLVLDVTVVVRNQGTESEYYYTQYMLNAVESMGSVDNGSSNTSGNGSGSSGGSVRWKLLSVWLSSAAACLVVICLTAFGI